MTALALFLVLGAEQAPAPPQAPPVVAVLPAPPKNACPCGGNPDDKRCDCEEGRCRCLSADGCVCIGDYSSARKESLRTGKPLVVWAWSRGVPFCVPGCVCTSEERQTFRVDHNCVLIALPENGDVYTCRKDELPQGATAEEIGEAVKRAVERERKAKEAQRQAQQFPAQYAPAFAPQTFFPAPANCAGKT